MANPIERARDNLRKAFQFNPERRRFLTEALPVYGALSFLAGSGIAAIADMDIEYYVTRRKFYGRYIHPQESGVFTVAEQPQVVHMQPIPEERYPYKGAVLVRREPHLDTPLLTQPVDTLKTSYAVRVFGEGFDPQRITENSKGTIWITEDHTRHLGGQWLMFSNAEGTPINPYTEQEIDLGQGEKPFYSTTDFKLF